MNKENIVRVKKFQSYRIYSSCYFFSVSGPLPLGCASSESASLTFMRFNGAFGLNFNYVSRACSSSYYVRNPSTLSYRLRFLISWQICAHLPSLSLILLGYGCNFSVVFSLCCLSTFPSQPPHLPFLAYQRTLDVTEAGAICGASIGRINSFFGMIQLMIGAYTSPPRLLDTVMTQAYFNL